MMKMVRSLVVTLLCGVWIVLLLRSHTLTMFETVSGVALAIVVIASVWWTKINRHPALGTSMLCLITALVFCDAWLRKGLTDSRTLFSGTIFIVLLILLIAKLRSVGGWPRSRV
jgi:hypothetical protein